MGCLEFLRRQPLHTYKCHTALTRSIIFPTSCNLSSPYSWLLTSFLCIWIKYFRLAVLSFSLKKLLTSLSSSFNLSARKKSTFKQFCCKNLKLLFFQRYKLLWSGLLLTQTFYYLLYMQSTWLNFLNLFYYCTLIPCTSKTILTFTFWQINDLKENSINLSVRKKYI